MVTAPAGEPGPKMTAVMLILDDAVSWFLTPHPGFVYAQQHRGEERAQLLRT